MIKMIDLSVCIQNNKAGFSRLRCFHGQYYLLRRSRAMRCLAATVPATCQAFLILPSLLRLNGIYPPPALGYPRPFERPALRGIGFPDLVPPRFTDLTRLPRITVLTLTGRLRRLVGEPKTIFRSGLKKITAAISPPIMASVLFARIQVIIFSMSEYFFQ